MEYTPTTACRYVLQSPLQIGRFSHQCDFFFVTGKLSLSDEIRLSGNLLIHGRKDGDQMRRNTTINPMNVILVPLFVPFVDNLCLVAVYKIAKLGLR